MRSAQRPALPARSPNNLNGLPPPNNQQVLPVANHPGNNHQPVAPADTTIYPSRMVTIEGVIGNNGPSINIHYDHPHTRSE